MNNLDNLRILYLNAIAGSIVNSDLLIRAAETDIDSTAETLLSSKRQTGLRQSDEEVVTYLLTNLDYLRQEIEQIRNGNQSTSRSVTNYLQNENQESLEELVQTLDNVKLSIYNTSEFISTLKNSYDQCQDDLKSSKIKVAIEKSKEHLSRLADHLEQLFMLTLAIEGSAVKCLSLY